MFIGTVETPDGEIIMERFSMDAYNLVYGYIDLRDGREPINGDYEDWYDFEEEAKEIYPELIYKTYDYCVSAKELIEALEKIQDKRKKLMKYDLLSQDSSLDNEIEVDHIEENDVKVLNLYVLDTNKKLSSFDDIYEKINTFVEVLNRKLIFKKVKVNSRRGFYFVRLDSNMEACDGEEKLLSLSKLSSGEQHQVVLLYQLIFNTEPQTLVLIDEPEISLHVVWQKQFMEDLVEVSKINNIKSIIATHSPQIIGDKWNSTIDLADLREQEVIDQ